MNNNKLKRNRPIAIIGAMKEEISLLSSLLAKPKKNTIAGVNFIKGTLASHTIVIAQSGIGKVSAAHTTTLLHERFNPSVIFNIGTAGGINPKLSIGDVVLADRVVHHDFDVSAISNALYGQVPGSSQFFLPDKLLLNQIEDILFQLDINSYSGLLASGDKFLSDEKALDNILKHFPNLLAVDMEAASIAQICQKYKTPFIILRAISDIPKEESPLNFVEFLQLASKNSTNVIVKFLQIYPNPN